MDTTTDRYVHLDMNEEGETRNPLDEAMEAEIGKALCDAYWRTPVSWLVEANGVSGFVKITCPELHQMGNQNYGVVLHIRKLPTYLSVRKAAVMKGGELLERAFVNRETGVRTRDEVHRD